MQRFYLSEIIGAGTTDSPFRPALRDVLEAFGGLVRWGADDFRTDQTVLAGSMICWADVIDAQHTAMIADSRITYVPFENAAGIALSVGDTIGDVPATLRSAIQSRLEAQHVPTDDLTLSTPLRQVVARVIRRIRIRRALNGDDFVEGLDTLVSAMSVARRNAINTKLSTKGFDTSVILGTDTVRAAIRKLAVQAIAWLKNGWD